MPCAICENASGSASRPSVEWLCASITPGASTRPVASTTRSSGRGVSAPISTMVSPAMRTSTRRSGAPVPSATCAPRMVQPEFDVKAGNVMRGDAIGDASRNGLREIRQRDHRDVVASVAGDVALEALPRAAMSLHGLSGEPIDLEAKAIRMRPADIQRDGCEDLPPAVGVQHRAAADAAIPRDQILQRQIQRAVSGRVHRRRDPFLVAQLAAFEAISVGAIRDDVGLADHARRGHAQRREDAIAKDVAVERARHLAHQRAEQDVAGVAVLPLAAPGVKSSGSVAANFTRSSSL